MTGASTKCGAPNPQLRDCPKINKDNVQASAGNVSSVQSGHRPCRGGRFDTRLPRTSETGGRVRARDQRDTTDVVDGKFSLPFTNMFALFDLGSMHPCVCSSVLNKKVYDSGIARMGYSCYESAKA